MCFSVIVFDETSAQVAMMGNMSPRRDLQMSCFDQHLKGYSVTRFRIYILATEIVWHFYLKNLISDSDSQNVSIQLNC